MFYDDDVVIELVDPEWLKRDIDSLVMKFRWMGLSANIKKTKSMTSLPRYIITHQSKEVYTYQMTGIGSSY